jgi:hypothetical protein
MAHETDTPSPRVVVGIVATADDPASIEVTDSTFRSKKRRG